MTVQELTKQLQTARRQVVTDGYDMSLGEIASMYRSEELVIDPNYQRLYRWEPSQRTRFIESLLLGIPIPPIFVFQRKSGVWELIDGLQRLSTVLQFMGELKNPEGGKYPPLYLGGTNLLPSLSGMRWKNDGAHDEGDESNNGKTDIQKSDEKEEADNFFDTATQLALKRTRIRVEILQKESDEEAKYELFQRLNTGGSKLSEQEVRNSVLVMLNVKFFKWLDALTHFPAFEHTVRLTSKQQEERQAQEIALRFVAYRRHPYQRGLDVNEYLDVAARNLARLKDSDLDEEQALFEWTFNFLKDEVGEDVFKKWDGTRHLGAFSISAFDAIAYGVAFNHVEIAALKDSHRKAWIIDRVHALWSEKDFSDNSGSGVRGTTRLTNLLPFVEKFFHP